MVYALSAYNILGVNVNAIMAKIEESKQSVQEEEYQPEPLTRLRRPGKGGRPGGFVNSWR